MKIQLSLILFSALILYYCFSIKTTVFASNQFIENFSEDKNGDFPSQWVLGLNNCQYNGSSANWTVINGKVNIKSDNSCATDIYPSDTAWGNIGNNYTVEFDMDLVSGVDHNFIFKKNGTDYSNWNEIHIAVPDTLTIDTINPVITYNGNFALGSTQHFKIEVIENKIKVFLNNGVTPIMDTIDSKSSFPGRIALASRPAGGLSETYFSNIVVSSIDVSTPTPTPTPSPLPVPLLKQTDPQWRSNVYNGANNWAVPASYDTIGDWGCAMTSAAMVLNYYGINKLPDGTILNPGTLNIWLKNNNGYADGINNGYLVPGAITALSKQAKAINNITEFDMLEAHVIPNFDFNQLANDINNSHPEVIGVNGNSHFVAATGVNGNTFFINDPYFKRTLLTDYGNTFASLTEYSPAHSDGSYIMAIGTNNIDYILQNSNGDTIGNQFIQNPIIDPITGNTSGNSSLNDFFLKPDLGNYFILVTDPGSDPQNYRLNLYLYDKNANLTLKKIQGIISSGKQDSIKIQFDHDNANNTKADRIITFDSLLQDITQAENLSMISHKARVSLRNYANKAKKDSLFGRKNFVKLDLDLLLLYLKIYKAHGVMDMAFTILSNDAKYLEARL